MKVLVNRLTIDCVNKEFTTEASDLGGVPGEITLVSDGGTESTFVRTMSVKDGEGEVTHWLYDPKAESVVKIPGLQGWCLTVFND